MVDRDLPKTRHQSFDKKTWISRKLLKEVFVHKKYFTDTFNLS